MPGYIPTGRKLLVVSDTAMSFQDNKILGFEPVVRELDSISHLFDEIIWLGFEKKDSMAPMALPFSPGMRLIPMPASGGAGMKNKIQIILFYCVYLFYILRYLPGITHLHSRAPSHPALIAMWLSGYMTKIVCWHKYAGSWSESDSPGSYVFQRNNLKSIRKQNVYGTINGKWQNQEKHLITFENPCLSDSELIRAKEFAKAKKFDGKLILLFVGNLSYFKGVIQLVEALSLIKNKEKYEHLYIAGDGPLKKELDKLSQKSVDIKISVLGALKREELAKLYSIAHINILPSASEGFPKVIAEGAAYGCIPLVSNISSIDQYIIHGKNGFLLEATDPQSIAHRLDEITSYNELDRMSKEVNKITSLFTYEYFVEKIKTHFIKNENPDSTSA